MLRENTLIKSISIYFLTLAVIFLAILIFLNSSFIIEIRNGVSIQDLNPKTIIIFDSIFLISFFIFLITSIKTHLRKNGFEKWVRISFRLVVTIAIISIPLLLFVVLMMTLLFGGMGGFNGSTFSQGFGEVLTNLLVSIPSVIGILLIAIGIYLWVVFNMYKRQHPSI